MRYFLNKWEHFKIILASKLKMYTYASSLQAFPEFLSSELDTVEFDPKNRTLYEFLYFKGANEILRISRKH